MMTVSKCCPDKPSQARGLCKNHYDKWLKDSNPSYAERQALNCRNWTTQHYQEMQAYRKEYVKTVPISVKRSWYLRYKYGIDEGTYQGLLQKQLGVCVLCGAKPKIKRFHVDHDHITGRIRGILCHQCNWYLGKIDKDPSLLIRIAEYRKGTDDRFNCSL